MDDASADGAFGYGYALWTGKGVARDVPKARSLFDEAAVGGVGGAMAYKVRCKGIDAATLHVD